MIAGDEYKSKFEGFGEWNIWSFGQVKTLDSEVNEEFWKKDYSDEYVKNIQVRTIHILY